MNSGYVMDEEIYCFNSADEAIAFLAYHTLDKRTETILTTFITRLQRENSKLQRELDLLKGISEI